MDNFVLSISDLISTLQDLLESIDQVPENALQELVYDLSGETIDPTADSLSNLINYLETNKDDLEAQAFKNVLIDNIHLQLEELEVQDIMQFPDEQALLDNENSEAILISEDDQ